MVRKIDKDDTVKILELLKKELGEFDERGLEGKLEDQENSCLIYESNGQIRGFSIASIFNKTSKRGAVSLYVSEPYRRNGIGEKLYSVTLEYFEKLGIDTFMTEIRTEKNATGDFFINRGLNKWYGYHKMVYSGGKVNCDLQLVNYDDHYYEAYKEIYENCFYQMRKALDFKPHRDGPTPEELKENNNKIFLLLDGEELIGSVFLPSDEIDDLIVNEKYQGQGYGKQLLNFGINYYQSRGVRNISLGVVEWNVKAVRLYENSGFNSVASGEIFKCIKE